MAASKPVLNSDESGFNNTGLLNTKVKALVHMIYRQLH